MNKFTIALLAFNIFAITACTSLEANVKSGPNADVDEVWAEFGNKRVDTHWVCEISDFPSCMQGSHHEDVGGKIVNSNAKIIGFSETTDNYMYALVQLDNGTKYYQYFPTLSPERKAERAAAEALAKLPTPKIGMTEAEAWETRWGAPDHINYLTYGGTSSPGLHTHDQWVFTHHGYLYFEDGKLTAVQISY